MQFEGTNFSNWKFRVEILLRKHNVAHCLTEETPSETAAKAAFIGKYSTAIPLLVHVWRTYIWNTSRMQPQQEQYGNGYAQRVNPEVRQN
ncbi:unnamed protein product [Macrosiphum euphorbiae]|uniref:DUF4219 domain-containing protein n=1 Tax=Macrosiphum euphorbiae TaxID=13131 RepID=A0AAV0WAV0_9HEMI|nr:unnamed protein product [Macrosiphum euphorbiae]